MLKMTRRQLEIEIESHYDRIADLQKQLARMTGAKPSPFVNAVREDERESAVRNAAADAVGQRKGRC